jgi:hypothetical protein
MRLITASCGTKSRAARDVAPVNQSKFPQRGQVASPGGRDGSSHTMWPQSGHSFGSPSGVRLDDFMARFANSAGKQPTQCGAESPGQL